LQQDERASEVLLGTPLMLPTAQKTSVVGNCVKSAVEQALLAVAAAEDVTRDIVVKGDWCMLDRSSEVV
jgi:hypothetical protein